MRTLVTTSLLLTACRTPIEPKPTTTETETTETETTETETTDTGTPIEETGTDTGGPLTTTTVPPDTNAVAYVANRIANTISEIDLTTGAVIDTITLPPTNEPGFPGPIKIESSADGSRLASTSGTHVHVIETSTNVATTYEHRNIGEVAFSPTSDVLVMLDVFRQAVVPFDLADPVAPLDSLDDNSLFHGDLEVGTPLDMDWHPVTHELVATTFDATHRFGAEVVLGSLTAPVTSTKLRSTCPAPEVEVLSNGFAYLSCVFEGAIGKLDLATESFTLLPLNLPSVMAITASPDETLLAVIEDSGPLDLVDVASETRVGPPFQVGDWALDVEFTPDGRYAVAVSPMDERMTVIDLVNLTTYTHTGVGGTPADVAIVDKSSLP